MCTAPALGPDLRPSGGPAVLGQADVGGRVGYSGHFLAGRFLDATGPARRGEAVRYRRGTLAAVSGAWARVKWDGGAEEVIELRYLEAAAD